MGLKYLLLICVNRLCSRYCWTLLKRKCLVFSIAGLICLHQGCQTKFGFTGRVQPN